MGTFVDVNYVKITLRVGSIHVTFRYSTNFSHKAYANFHIP